MVAWSTSKLFLSFQWYPWHISSISAYQWAHTLEKKRLTSYILQRKFCFFIASQKLLINFKSLKWKQNHLLYCPDLCNKQNFIECTWRHFWLWKKQTHKCWFWKAANSLTKFHQQSWNHLCVHERDLSNCNCIFYNSLIKAHNYYIYCLVYGEQT